MIKAIFFDIDGTLVSFETHKIPKSTLKVLSELRMKGIKLFIATGRPFIAINNLNDLKFDGYITLNGGYCLDENQDVVYRTSIESKDIKSLVDFQKNVFSFPCVFVTENEMYINYVNDDVIKVLELVDFPELHIIDIEAVKQKEIFQMMAFFNEEQEKQIFSEVLLNCQPARWNPLFTDIIPSGCDKSLGMQSMLKHYDINVSESMAFGDGGNDISMLKYAGIGVAMGNADNNVKKYANFVTDSVDNEGIRKALEYFKII